MGELTWAGEACLFSERPLKVEAALVSVSVRCLMSKYRQLCDHSGFHRCAVREGKVTHVDGARLTYVQETQASCILDRD